jgi:hypothetical protein
MQADKESLRSTLHSDPNPTSYPLTQPHLGPSSRPSAVLKIIGTTDADAQAQQAAGHVVHQGMIDGLVAEGKFLWQAFQAGNDVGHNNNNNTQGGFAFDAAYCTQWMAQRCNTAWVNERAITVQFDSFNVNVSIASFLIVRPAYAWIGYGAGYLTPKWNDAFLWDVGVPVSDCRSGSAPGTFERDWTYGTATMDCNSYSATVPCNPADTTCGEPPRPPPPPPGPPGNWSPAHNCTGCGSGGAQPIASFVNLDFLTCQLQCKANAKCSYVTWVSNLSKRTWPGHHHLAVQLLWSFANPWTRLLAQTLVPAPLLPPSAGRARR